MRKRNKQAAVILGATLALGTVLSPMPAGAADVTSYATPPSIDEMRSGLGLPSAQPPRRLRSIQFDSDAPGAPPASSAEGTTAPPPRVTAAIPSAPRHQAPSKSASYKAAATSEKAVALPIKFDYNSATIREESYPFIEAAAKLLTAEPGAQLVIEGHTDATGSYAHNMALSHRRAAAVRNLLIKQYGISPARLVAVGKGPTELLTPENPTGEANRRVQFRLRS